MAIGMSERACDRCHFSKRNCSMQLPKCVRCSNLNLVCTYDRPKLRNRKVPPGKLVSSLPVEDFSLTRLVSHHTLLRLMAGMMELSPKGPPKSQRMLWEVVKFHKLMLKQMVRKEVDRFLQYGNINLFHTAIEAYFEYVNPYLPLFTMKQFHSRPRSRLLLLSVYASGLARLPGIQPDWLLGMHFEIKALALLAKPSLDTVQALFVIFSSLHGVFELQNVSDFAMYSLLPMAHLLGLHRPSRSIERNAAYLTIAHYLHYNHCIMRSSIYIDPEATFLADFYSNFNAAKHCRDEEEACFYLTYKISHAMFVPLRALIGLRHLQKAAIVPKGRLSVMASQLESQYLKIHRQCLEELDFYSNKKAKFQKLLLAHVLHHRTFLMALAEFQYSLTLDAMPLVRACIDVIRMAPHVGPKPTFQGRFFSVTLALIALSKFIPLNLPEVGKALEIGLHHLDPTNFPFLDPVNLFQANLVTASVTTFH